MAVEIHVLSGSQQGRCLRFDGDRILVGDDAAADLRFDPDREAGARGKNAVLTLDDEEGWLISNEGGGVWLVNQTAVPAGALNRLRSDDLVRVSELGPEFYFRLVARARGAAIPAPASPDRHEPQKSDGPPQREFAARRRSIDRRAVIQTKICAVRVKRIEIHSTPCSISCQKGRCGRRLR